jgi:phosphoglycolate phosphatase
MAGNAGAAAISVHYGAHPAAELAAHAPLFGAESIGELRAWLNEHA